MWWKNLVKRNVARKRRSYRLWLEELEVRCQPSVSGYSPVTEIGNNAGNPTLGTAGTDLLRISPADYKPVANGGDGLNTPSLTYGAPTFVAGPRLVSNVVDNQAAVLFGDPSTDINTVDGNSMSDFGYTFGQFIDHDLDLTPTQSSPAPPGDLAANKDGPNGFPIPVDPTHTSTSPPADPLGSSELAFTRSVFDPNTGNAGPDGITGTADDVPRQQINAVTSYLDLSQVYGSTQFISDALRVTNPNGSLGYLLKTSPGNLLPYDSLAYFTQDQINALNMANDTGLVSTDQLFAAGDVRANENIELTALQTLFMRNHNRIANALAQLNPTWTDQQLFQEARKINIGDYQNIIYTQYLPALLGAHAMPSYTGYDSTVDPSIATEFSTVGFRFGHSMLNNLVARDANDGSSVGDLQLVQAFFDPNLVTANGAPDPLTGLASTDIGAILKGDADNTAQAVDVMAVSDIRNLLFDNPGSPPGAPVGDDLIARDVWRADDHGIGTYNQLRVAYGLAPITDSGESDPGILPGQPGFRFHGFEQISSDPAVVQKLITAFTGPSRNTPPDFLSTGHFAGDINPFIAGLAEDHVPGSDMGPLFTNILVNQFTRLRSGDQFFYLNESWNLQELLLGAQGLTLGQIIKNNTDITNLQFNVFKISTLIGGRVFFDNNTSLPGFLQPPAAGVTVELRDSTGTVVATTVTNQYGFYSFNQQNGVDSTGLYTVDLVLPSDLTQVTADPSAIDITSGGTIVLGVNFGIQLTP
jgi:hypothetical protein